MEIKRIQNITYTPNGSGIVRKTQPSKFRCTTLPKDEFCKTKKTTDINFTGKNLYDELIIRYLKRKSIKNSIRGSKRPYLSVCEELENIVNEVKIPVSPTEKILAWDMNPHNSNDYIIFLHGFSQNITSNQKLYKELLKSRFGILAIEYRGYGKNPPSKKTTENDLVQDVKSAINYLHAKECKCEGFIGHSFGAYVATKAAGETKPSFTVLISPMLSMEFWLKKVIKHPKRYPIEFKMIKYLARYKQQYNKVFNISEHVEKNIADTYIIQSHNDCYVRTYRVDELVKKIPNLKGYIKLAKGGHSMNDSKIFATKSVIDDL